MNREQIIEKVMGKFISEFEQEWFDHYWFWRVRQILEDNIPKKDTKTQVLIEKYKFIISNIKNKVKELKDRWLTSKDCAWLYAEINAYEEVIEDIQQLSYTNECEWCREKKWIIDDLQVKLWKEC
jgi:hypothetical protein